MYECKPLAHVLRRVYRLGVTPFAGFASAFFSSPLKAIAVIIQ
jgi:hypothetical protein